MKGNSSVCQILYMQPKFYFKCQIRQQTLKIWQICHLVEHVRVALCHICNMEDEFCFKCQIGQRKF